MPVIQGLFPRATHVYGWNYEGENDQILDLVHNSYKRCYFKDCKVIIADTLLTNIASGLLECQFDDCEITIIKRVSLDTPENRGVHANQQITTPIAMHVDVMARPTSDKNLITVRMDQAVKEKLGQQRTIQWLRHLMSQSQQFSFRFR